MAKISGQRKIYEMINNRITSLLEKGDISLEQRQDSSSKPYFGKKKFRYIKILE